MVSQIEENRLFCTLFAVQILKDLSLSVKTFRRFTTINSKVNIQEILKK